MDELQKVPKSYCNLCGSKLISYAQKKYNEYTGEIIYKLECPKYGCENHCDAMGGCKYVQKGFFSFKEDVCERCGNEAFYY